MRLIGGATAHGIHKQVCVLHSLVGLWLWWGTGVGKKGKIAVFQWEISVKAEVKQEIFVACGFLVGNEWCFWS